MTATASTDAGRVSLSDRSRNVRHDALAALMDIAYDDPARYDPRIVIGRPHFIPVIVRDALCATHLPAAYGTTTCGRCLTPSGDVDRQLLDQVVALAPVAQGHTLAVMDVLADGHLPDVGDAPPSPESTAAALEAWSNLP